MIRRQLIGAVLAGLPGLACFWSLPFLWTREDWGMNFGAVVILQVTVVLLSAGALIGAVVSEVTRRKRRVSAVPHALGSAALVVMAALASGVGLQLLLWGTTTLR